jgi:hypothetical protein
LASGLLLTDTGVSQHCLKIQSVVCDTTIWVDHTFQVHKNYPTSVRDKAEALCRISVETCAGVVPTMAIKEVVHAVEQFLRQKSVQRKVI